MTTAFYSVQPPFLKNCNLRDCLVSEDGIDTVFTGKSFDDVIGPRRHTVTVPADDNMCLPFAGSKIMATIGPSCQDADILASMLHAGMVSHALSHDACSLPTNQPTTKLATSLSSLHECW